MGQCYKFTCSNCAHSVEVSGEPDAGMAAATETMVCVSCRDLVDVVVEEGPPGQSVSTRGHLRCPNCHGASLEPWDRRKRPCPKCGGQMKRGEVTVMWD